MKSYIDVLVKQSGIAAAKAAAASAAGIPKGKAKGKAKAKAKPAPPDATTDATVFAIADAPDVADDPEPPQKKGKLALLDAKLCILICCKSKSCVRCLTMSQIRKCT